ncbi:helix-turn-helix domain-containing protein [Methylorubrum extorquens]|uniref:helix-turn-helix domain-containing protein n=1 Tax=Methylorubrum extorquens TaxID=408 RepID=UPI001FCAE1DC|nr:helix-turn-helix domain-containing protein [Methylorubrum extorquens]MCP1545370.1 excisionase family DNA binding protein [Methylorubrum extorquens]MCP1587283.1 excisionase family DNA binding protein [Methylorubrum extorquens]
MPRAKQKTIYTEGALAGGPERETGGVVPKQFLVPLAYRPADAAHVLGVSRATVYKLITQGDLKARQIGGAILIRHNDLMELVDGAPLSAHTKFAQESIK